MQELFWTQWACGGYVLGHEPKDITAIQHGNRWGSWGGYVEECDWKNWEPQTRASETLCDNYLISWHADQIKLHVSVYKIYNLS